MDICIRRFENVVGSCKQMSNRNGSSIGCSLISQLTFVLCVDGRSEKKENEVKTFKKK